MKKLKTKRDFKKIFKGDLGFLQKNCNYGSYMTVYSRYIQSAIYKDVSSSGGEMSEEFLNQCKVLTDKMFKIFQVSLNDYDLDLNILE